MESLSWAIDSTPVTELKGVGAKVAEKLQRLHIETLHDLLQHLPARYEDRTRITPFSMLSEGEFATLEGEITAVSMRPGRKTTLGVTLAAQGYTVTLRFFHFSPNQAKAFKNGQWIRAYGEIKYGFQNWEIIHPEYHIFNRDNPPPLPATYTAIYPLTEGISQNQLRKWIGEVLDKAGLNNDYERALAFCHRPPSDTPLDDLETFQTPPQQALIREEFMAHRLALLSLKEDTVISQAPKLAGHCYELTRLFKTHLSFELTDAQTRVLREISADLALNTPMMRLVQGDVGSGKTVIAALSALQVIEGEHQVALMAPTELLAQQHFESFQAWFEPLSVPIGFLSSALTAKQKREIYERLSSGELKMVIGTHALFQKHVEFHSLGLVIIDEQHRFGVHQRLALAQKAGDVTPHQLVMTATPIPRTLAMTAYGDLNVSAIDQLPAGRQPIQTIVLPNNRREELIQRVHNACLEGQQVYWVCPLIEDSEVLQYHSAESVFAELQEHMPEIKIGLVHGRHSAQQKDAVMRPFSDGETQLLVATTVIEVGVNVPNATLMIIEHADRLGLAQLHQLRGRVGRGSKASSCVLLYEGPLSETGQTRLGVMRDSTDGFYIAEKDLEIRGPGEILGTRQTGLMSFKIADLVRDQDLIEVANDQADELWQNSRQEAQIYIERWLAHNLEYGQVG